MEQQEKKEKKVFVNDKFRKSVTEAYSVPTSQQIISLTEFAVGSIMAAPGREGWKEGVADGYIRQLVKVFAAEDMQKWGGGVGYEAVSTVIRETVEGVGISQKIKDILLANEIDLEKLRKELLRFFLEVDTYICRNYGKYLEEVCDRLDENEWLPF